MFFFIFLINSWLEVTIRQVWRRWRWRRGWWRRWSWSAGPGSRYSRSWCRSRYRIGTPAMTIFIFYIQSLQFQLNLCLHRFSKFKFYARETQSDSSAKSRVFELETLIFSFIDLFGKSQFLKMFFLIGNLHSSQLYPTWMSPGRLMYSQ